ncbi:Ppx/GppA phosphatase family protein [Anaerotignum sp.]
MICAIIDIGSNTMRMSVYKIEGQQFSVLLSKKETAGLANYITEGEMSEEGIGVMIGVLRRFCASLEYVTVDTIHAFATASLRNITNSEQAIERIHHAVGLEIELISGEEEAIMSFSGAVNAAPFEDGCLFDLGGGSTEIVAFDDRHPYYINSIGIGCLNLYKEHVEKIWPKRREIEEMRNFIEGSLTNLELPHVPKPLLIGVGGTARSLRGLINLRENRDASCKEITRKELEDTIAFLLKKDTAARDAVLKKCPDRIHTIIPGALVIQTLAKKMHAERLYISDYGVREGYLWKKIIKLTT